MTRHRLAVDADGNAFVVWTQQAADGFRVRAARYTAASDSWSAVMTISRDVAVDDAGNAFVVWYTGTPVAPTTV